MRKYNERIEQAIVNNCSVIYDQDKDFGTIELLEASPSVPDRLIDADKINHLNPTEQEQLGALLERFHAVFSRDLGECKLVSHEIKLTPEFVPRRLRAYRTPELLRGEVSRQIREMVDKGIIVPSQSPMVSPLVC